MVIIKTNQQKCKLFFFCKTEVLKICSTLVANSKQNHFSNILSGIPDKMCKQCPDGRFPDFSVLVGNFPNPFDHTSAAARSGER